jgi:putative Mg2+ transporter-C (MgtC) family protein
MRTYGIVCMASAALVSFAGFPSHWYGGGLALAVSPDPTRLVQGIVTGVGFLGAGVILREGPNIRGLTTAASIWASSAIGVLVGVGFYAAAMLLTALSATLMMWGRWVEGHLPCRQSVVVVIRFAPGVSPDQSRLSHAAQTRGYDLAADSIAVSYSEARTEWRFVAVATDRREAAPVSELAHELAAMEGVEHFQLTPARN